jgi:hypothetical protein
LKVKCPASVPSPLETADMRSRVRMRQECRGVPP